MLGMLPSQEERAKVAAGLILGVTRPMGCWVSDEHPHELGPSYHETR
jgi:hypothetical protein